MQRDVGVLVGAKNAGTRVVDPDVYAAEGCFRLLGEALHGFRIGNVGWHRKRTTADRLALGCETLEEFGASGGKNHSRALFRKRQTCRAPDSAGGAGYDYARPRHFLAPGQAS